MHHAPIWLAKLGLFTAQNAPPPHFKSPVDWLAVLKFSWTIHWFSWFTFLLTANLYIYCNYPKSSFCGMRCKIQHYWVHSFSLSATEYEPTPIRSTFYRYRPISFSIFWVIVFQKISLQKSRMCHVTALRLPCYAVPTIVQSLQFLGPNIFLLAPASRPTLGPTQSPIPWIPEILPGRNEAGARSGTLAST
jgi:hypothetical protein